VTKIGRHPTSFLMAALTRGKGVGEGKGRKELCLSPLDLIQEEAISARQGFGEMAHSLT